MGLLLLVGCHSDTGSSSAAGRRIDTTESIRPELAPAPKALLRLAGVKVPVEVKYAVVKNQVNVQLFAHGEVFEKEGYITDPEAFRLQEAADGTYAPPLDLLRFPMHVGDKWSWSGRMVTGGISRPTKATVTTSTGKVYAGALGMDAVQVNVDLEIYADPGRSPSKRKLSFWFVPQKGLVRREFGTESIREPATP